MNEPAKIKVKKDGILSKKIVKKLKKELKKKYKDKDKKKKKKNEFKDFGKKKDKKKKKKKSGKSIKNRDILTVDAGGNSDIVGKLALLLKEDIKIKMKMSKLISKLK